MRMLHTKVNIVPVIAKADCLTKFEMQRLKRKVREWSTLFFIHVCVVVAQVPQALNDNLSASKYFV